MALSDFYEIKDHQVAFGRNLLNVYHVQRLLVGGKAVDIKDAFINHIVEDHLVLLQSVNVTRTTIEIANLGDATDFLTVDSSTLPGQRVGQTLAAFNAATIQLSRLRNDMKHGQKRYFVGGETDQDDGVWDAAFVTLLQSLADDLVTPWERDSSPGVDICELAVLQRYCIIDGQEPCLGYRLPDSSEIDTSFYIPLNTVVRSQVRSQVSRKVL